MPDVVDEDGRVALLDGVLQLASPSPRVERGDGDPELLRGIHGLHGFAAVAEERGNSVAASNPARLERAGQSVGPAVELLPGE
jgi:hypothetical protein